MKEELKCVSTVYGVAFAVGPTTLGDPDGTFLTQKFFVGNLDIKS